MDTFRWSVKYLMSGYPCELVIETGDSGETMRKSAAALKYLEEQGAVPAEEQAPAAPADESPPMCPIHKVPMKPSQIHGGYFCSKKLADGTYCKQQIDT